jgi:peptide/nickel transport system substrate-binding protein
MLDYFKFRLQRKLRRYKKEVKLWRAWGELYFERHVWGKWRQLGIIRRLVFGWWGILLLSGFGLILQTTALKDHYLVQRPLVGGDYAEGVVGTVKNLNPVLPESSAASDVNRLIFSGLVRHNPDRQVEGDLATSWDISPDGKSYTFHLRPNVKWHDGTPFSARDVVFTLVAIQNPDSRSPLAPAWQGVKAEVKDDLTVIITLPNPYAPFIHTFTVGILPSHKLETTDPSKLRVSSFNQRPVGTGPFKFKAFAADQGEIQLEAYGDYHLGRPKLERFSFRLFDSAEHMADAYAKRQIQGMARIRRDTEHRQLPEIVRYSLSFNSQVGVFFRVASPILTDREVRRALAMATDRRAVIDEVLGGEGIAVQLPLMPGQLGYTTKFKPPQFNPAEAEAVLSKAGWKKDGNARVKGDSRLKLRLVTSNSHEFIQTAEALRQQWRAIGVEVEVTSTDLSDLQQSFIRPRNYDLLLFGINIGADPDVYGYWHSSQSDDPGLNLSGYSNPNSDKALESGRINSDAETRIAKYGSFLANWSADVPAVMLYSNRYIYGVHEDAHGIVADKLVEPSDRFYSVENWTIRVRQVNRGSAD